MNMKIDKSLEKTSNLVDSFREIKENQLKFEKSHENTLNQLLGKYSN